MQKKKKWFENTKDNKDQFQPEGMLMLSSADHVHIQLGKTIHT